MGAKQQVEPPSSTTSTMPSYLAGSAAFAVRKIRRSVSVSTFQMDADDEKASRPVRESSLARAYNACGAELYRLDSGECEGPSGSKNARPRTGERSAMSMDKTDQMGNSRTARHSTSVRSAMAMDLGCESASRTSKAHHTKQRAMISKSPSDGHLTRGMPAPFMSLQPLVVPKSTSFLSPVSSIKVSPALALKKGSGGVDWYFEKHSFPSSAHMSGHLAWDARPRFGVAS